VVVPLPLEYVEIRLDNRVGGRVRDWLAEGAEDEDEMGEEANERSDEPVGLSALLLHSEDH
jgi:hypothetical protein